MTEADLESAILFGLCNADRRTVSLLLNDLAGRKYIPHPLKGIQYADGVGS